MTDFDAQTAEYNAAVARNADQWVAAASGQEPITEIDGKHYQWSFNPAQRAHAYYCFEDDLILDGELRDRLPACLKN